jgi:hypothetical protein
VESNLQGLYQLLSRRPVLLGGDPFVPVCLSTHVELLADGSLLVEELDTPIPHAVRPVAILKDDTPGGSRFGPPVDVKITAEEINLGLPKRLDYVRDHFLQQSHISARIAEEAVHQQYSVVVLIIVDGLSYADVQEWPWPVLPCFVDGPTITNTGYPNVVGQPAVSHRLHNVGLRRAKGFSYWDRHNKLTETIFTGVPLRRISNFPMLLDELRELDVQGTFIQIVREGLDRLAHHRREVSLPERQATVDEIARNCEALAELLRSQGLFGCIFLTADHGLLWKVEHNFATLVTSDHAHPRYATSSPENPELAMSTVVRGQRYYAYFYPYLGSVVPDNDAGVHGGCSYQESFVPFVRIEVQP